tara:strand:+ start:212 stop:379 length:168 start_codon:yes stop_codon:yes gene_type:complete
MSLLNSLTTSTLGFGGATPPVTNPNPLGIDGIKTLDASELDRNGGATPPSYNPST